MFSLVVKSQRTYVHITVCITRCRTCRRSLPSPAQHLQAAHVRHKGLCVSVSRSRLRAFCLPWQNGAWLQRLRVNILQHCYIVSHCLGATAESYGAKNGAGEASNMLTVLTLSQHRSRSQRDCLRQLRSRCESLPNLRDFTP